MFVEKKVLSLETARRIAAAAEAEARRNQWSVVIALVDDSGLLQLLHRLDNTQAGSVEVAQGKARTAALFRRTSKAMEESVSSGRAGLLNLPGNLPVEGGLPLIVAGQIIGAIGVSGVKSAEDGQIAAAGVAELERLLAEEGPVAG